MLYPLTAVILFLSGFIPTLGWTENQSPSKQKVTTAICGPLLGGEINRLGPQSFLVFINQQIKTLENIKRPTNDSSEIELTLKRLTLYQLDLREPSQRQQMSAIALEILHRFQDLLHQLDRLMLTQPKYQLTTITSLSQFLKVHKDSGLAYIFGRTTLDMMSHWKKDYRLSDILRQQIAQSLAEITGEVVTPVMSSATLEQQDMISFLGRTKNDLSPTERSAFNEVIDLIPYADQSEKLELYNIVLRGQEIPKKFYEHSIDQAHLSDENHFFEQLHKINFRRLSRLHSPKGKLIYQHPKTQTTIIVPDDPVDVPMRKFNPDQQEYLRQVLRDALQKTNEPIILNFW